MVILFTKERTFSLFQISIARRRVMDLDPSPEFSDRLFVETTLKKNEAA